MKKATKAACTLTLSQHEWCLLTLSIATALEQRTCPVSFPTKSCKTYLRKLDKRLWSYLKEAPKPGVSHG